MTIHNAILRRLCIHCYWLCNSLLPHHYISTVGYIDLTDLALPDDQLIWPTNVTKLTRGFSNGHTGMDVDARTGDPVYAAFPGTVTTVSHVGPYGNKIIISHPTHPERISTLYAHLTDTYVQVGAVVTVGQTIGTVGASGNADGDHLHFEVRTGEAQVDPQNYF